MEDGCRDNRNRGEDDGERWRVDDGGRVLGACDEVRQQGKGPVNMAAAARGSRIVSHVRSEEMMVATMPIVRAVL